MRPLSEVFKLDRDKFNLPRGLVIFAILIVPLIVLAAIDKSQYWLSVSFGALFVGSAIPEAKWASGWPRCSPSRSLAHS